MKEEGLQVSDNSMNRLPKIWFLQESYGKSSKK